MLFLKKFIDFFLNVYVYLVKKLINWNIFFNKFNKYINVVVFMYIKRKLKKVFFLLIKI